MSQEEKIQAYIQERSSHQCQDRYETTKKIKYQKIALLGILAGLLLAIIFLFIIPLIFYIPLLLSIGFLILWIFVASEVCPKSESSNS